MIRVVDILITGINQMTKMIMIFKGKRQQKAEELQRLSIRKKDITTKQMMHPLPREVENLTREINIAIVMKMMMRIMILENIAQRRINPMIEIMMKMMMMNFLRYLMRKMMIIMIMVCQDLQQNQRNPEEVGGRIQIKAPKIT